MFERFLSLFALDDPSEYEEFYEGLSWKNFRVDSTIYDRCYHKDLLVYCRQLQHCYEGLLQERSDSYLYDVAEIRERFNNANFRVCTLEREKAQLQGKVDYLEMQLELARQWQTASGRKNEVDSNLGREVQEVKQKTQKEGTKFKSNNGASKQENQMLASAYHENGWSIQEIAEDLHLSTSTIKSYVSTMQKHYQVKQRRGGKYIIFDDDYGNIEWNLHLYAKLEDKFPENVVSLAANTI